MSLFNSLFRDKPRGQVLTEREFSELLERQQRPLLSLALRLVGNWEDAKDLAQTAFVRLWQHRQRLEAGRDAAHYLHRVLVNLCIDHLRRRGQHEPPLAFDETLFVQADSNPQRQLEDSETQNRLWQCLNALPPKQKATLILREVEGYSVAETAEILSCSQNSVLGNLHLARKKVKEKMQRWLAAQE